MRNISRTNQNTEKYFGGREALGIGRFECWSISNLIEQLGLSTTGKSWRSRWLIPITDKLCTTSAGVNKSFRSQKNKPRREKNFQLEPGVLTASTAREQWRQLQRCVSIVAPALPRSLHQDHRGCYNPPLSLSLSLPPSFRLFISHLNYVWNISGIISGPSLILFLVLFLSSSFYSSFSSSLCFSCIGLLSDLAMIQSIGFQNWIH